MALLWCRKVFVVVVMWEAHIFGSIMDGNWFINMRKNSREFITLIFTF